MNAVMDEKNDKVNENTVCQFIDMLKSLERNAIELVIKSPDNAALSIGCSKYGGQPDVPDDFQWPMDDHNRPLSLLLQINCFDLIPYDTEGLLPKVGHLYFFYELSEQDWEGKGNSVRVIYIETQHTKLHRADYPKELVNDFRLKELPLSFAVRRSYPSMEDIDIQSDQYMMEYVDEFYEARARLQSESTTEVIGTMLGYADLIQNAIEEDLDKNVLLLQLSSIESEDSSKLMFGDCGSIYFYISRQDLKDKRFDRFKFELQSY